MSARKRAAKNTAKASKSSAATGDARKGKRNTELPSGPATELTPRPGQGVIEIRGARQNNLRSIDLDIPLGQLNVVTGPSGSGKSSLAVQTVYAEGQRRYVETFSPYTRQFFDRMDKPQVEDIRGIPPAIAIEQQNSVRTTRSTVGTMTEINDYLKLLFPRLAVGACPGCGQEVRPDTPAGIAAAAGREFAGKSVLVTIPVPCPPKTKPAEFFEFLQSQGYLRVWLFGTVHRTDEPKSYQKTTLPAVVPVVQDRLKVGKDPARLHEALETAFRLGKGRLTLVDPDTGTARAFSSGWHCADCDIHLREPSPALFSFNNPIGACPACRGFGRTIGIDIQRALPDKSLSIREGAVKAFTGQIFAESQKDLEKCAKLRGISLTTPFDELPEEDQHWIINGDPDYRSDPEAAWNAGAWYGVTGFFDWLEKRAYKMHYRVFLSRFRSYTDCKACQGGRLQPEALAFRIGGRTLPEWWRMPVRKLMPLVEAVPFPAGDATADLLQREILSRLQYLERVGLGYLSLDRSTRTLSGGETQRVNLTTCLGASLVNTLFVLDEPSVGLHPRDTGRLIEVMRQLTAKGNTLLVVEHEESIIRAADNLIDIGPGRGEDGGQLVFNGHPDKFPGLPGISLTADYLLGRKWIQEPEVRRTVDMKQALKIVRASHHNLKKLDVAIPLGRFVCVTGVSGSGKSTLIRDVLFENLIRLQGRTSENEPGACREIQGAEKVGRVIMVDQSPLSRTPRSTPAVYVGAFEWIRQVFAETPEAESENLTAGYFSFNSGAGRCERCGGNGHEKVEMQFLSDLYVQCPECEGRRYKQEALRIRLDGCSICDVLDFTVTEAIAFFGTRRQEPKCLKIAEALRRLSAVGLGYLRLGQPLNTLSGGESQRLKLVGHMLEESSGEMGEGGKPSLLIFDEPTTGLHFDDVSLLLEVFQEIVSRGQGIIVIEHNLDVIRCADWVIDLGPEAGEDGGHVVACGTPEEVMQCKGSHTGAALRQLRESPVREKTNKGRQPPRPTAAAANAIAIHGAREHNLKNIDVLIPRDQFVVVTGLSGSGKSTLAFDLVFAEGQRRFLDSMSTYARQFVEQMERPDVDHISGLPPTVAIEQRITRGGAKSTVATVTEVYHFLRLLWSKVGVQFCPKCRVPVREQSAGAIARELAELAAKTPLRIMAPVIRGRKGFHDKIAQLAGRQQCEELYIDGRVVPVEKFQRLQRFKEHHIDLVVGKAGKDTRLREIERMVAKALNLGRGVLRVVDAFNLPKVFSSQRTCPECSRSFDLLDPRLFSFNSPHGWCPNCRGYGFVRKGRSALDVSRANSMLEAELTEDQRLEHADDEELAPCSACQGTRLNEEGRAVQVLGRELGAVTALPVSTARSVLDGFKFSGTQEVIARDIRVEIEQRLKFLEDVGLGYLALNRSATTLSGGESQRIRLAAQLGSNLRGVLYVLDEPTIGLHPRDNARLLQTLTALRDKGNSLLVVEHDEETMLRADHIIDLGPGAGRFGGKVIAQGTPREIMQNPRSVTGPFISSTASDRRQFARRPIPGADAADGWIRLKGARANNLKSIDAAIPIGRLTVICGISGSGKSSLMRGCLFPAVQGVLNRVVKRKVRAFDSISGCEQLEGVYEVDQSPIGKTSRSTPATYLKLFDEIRALFAATPAARARGFTASRFSFNTEGGRCETCGGNGIIKHEMTFLPASYTKCSDCHGLRYNAATLEIDYNGKTIGEVCSLGIDEAADFFASHPKIRRTLHLLRETGLGYLQLGQASPTLSGGEAQRIKLVAELSRGESRAEHTRLRKNQRPKSNLYLIEEPTIGLHPADVQRLLALLQRLVDEGHTVVVIEHHLELIASADFVLDLGPEAGEDGGTIVAAGAPEEIANSKDSRTGTFLRRLVG
ncbi:MAG: excinuclease ABC subunit UvrA [Verrucomicrobiales bacterium]|nr:excinuclease ABC subunit UvrA [Verrucomicrobiales bacterium]